MSLGMGVASVGWPPMTDGQALSTALVHVTTQSPHQAFGFPVSQVRSCLHAHEVFTGLKCLACAFYFGQLESAPGLMAQAVLQTLS